MGAGPKTTDSDLSSSKRPSLDDLRALIGLYMWQNDYVDIFHLKKLAFEAHKHA